MINQNNKIERNKKIFYLNKTKEAITVFLSTYLFASFLKWLFVFLTGVGEDMQSEIVSTLIFFFVLIIGFAISIIYFYYAKNHMRRVLVLLSRPYIVGVLLVLSLIILFFQLNLAKFLVQIIPNETICRANLIETILVHNDPISMAVSRFPYRDCMSTLAITKKDPKICSKLKNKRNQESCFYLLAVSLKDYNVCNYLTSEFIEKKYNISPKNICINKVAEKLLDYKQCKTPSCIIEIARKLKDKKVCDYIKEIKNISEDDVKHYLEDCYNTYSLSSPVSKKNVDVKIPDQWQTCQQDSDCVETQQDCCSCNGGGKQVAINKKYLDQWKNILKSRCDVGCPGVYVCQKGKPVCKDNRCEFEYKYSNLSADREYYYNALAQKCQKQAKDSPKLGSCLDDCLKSVEIMRKNNYQEADSNGKCSQGFNVSTLKCPCSLRWCEPEKGNTKKQIGFNLPIYRNEKYGFELTLTDNWKKYKTKISEKENIVYIDFYDSIKNTKMQSDISGYVDLFHIIINREDEWNKSAKSCKNMCDWVDNEIGRKNGYVFSYGVAQDFGKLEKSAFNDIQKIISTFKFIDISNGLIEVSGSYDYYLQSNNPFKKGRVCFEPAQMETINNGELFCFNNTKEALNMFGIKNIDNTCKKYWGIAKIKIKDLTNNNIVLSKSDPCIKNNDCKFNEAELVEVVDLYNSKLSQQPQCEK